MQIATTVQGVMLTLPGYVDLSSAPAPGRSPAAPECKRLDLALRPMTEDAKREQAGDLLGRIVAMLTELCR